MSLLPVTWLEGWPIIGAVGEDEIGNMVWTAPKPIQIQRNLRIQTSDDYRSPNLNVQWEWNYQPRRDKWSLSERKGFLRLYATMPIHSSNPARILLRAANTITQRTMRTDSCTATIKMDVSKMVNGQFAGLTHYQY